MTSTIIKNGRVVRETGVVEQDILIENGIIKRMERSLIEEAKESIDATECLIFPGFIDCHVHFREPGMVEAEDMMSGARAARSGGVLAVCDMPNTDPPTCTLEALEDKQRRAAKIEYCDIRFFFGATKLEHLDVLQTISPNDICGVKVYFDHSTGKQKAEKSVIVKAFQICAERGFVLVGHCEDAELNAETKKNYDGTVVPHSKMRPPESEARAIEWGITLAKRYGTDFHVAHVSTAQGMELIRRGKKEGLSLTCEVSPHHLFLSVEEDEEALGPLGKVNPPLRTREHGRALWRGISDGTVDCIASDHAPHTLSSKKSGQPSDSPSGMPGVETMIPLLLSSFLTSGPKDQNGRKRGGSPSPLSPEALLRLCHSTPNRLFKLGKQEIEIGKPMEIVLVNTLKKWVIHGQSLHSKCSWTPYEGWEVQGSIERVLTRGRTEPSELLE